MQRRNAAITGPFAETVRSFLAEHWLSGGEPEAWRQALGASGWAIADWSVADGGLGWSAQQFGYWQRSCIAAAAPLPDPLTLRGIAPLIRKCESSQTESWLEGMRTLRERWCVAAIEPGLTVDVGLRLQRNGSDYRLLGTVRPVVHALDSQWALCAAQLEDSAQPLLLAISLAASGVDVTPLPMVGEVSGGRAQRQTQLATVHCRDVPVPGDHILCRSAAVSDWLVQLSRFAPALAPELTSATALARDLTDLATLYQAQVEPGEIEPAHAALGVRLAALEVLEARVLQASADAQEQAAALELMRRQQALQLKLDVTDALSAALGYQLLPYADPELTHNEPAMAEPMARERVAQMLRSRGLIAGHDPLDEQISWIGVLLGLDPGAVSGPGDSSLPDLESGLPKPAKKP